MEKGKITIKYDGNEYTIEQIKEEIIKFKKTLVENYTKFYEFCNKLDEGAFVWKWPDSSSFGGFHSKKMFFHGWIARELVQTHMWRDIYSG